MRCFEAQSSAAVLAPGKCGQSGAGSRLIHAFGRRNSISFRGSRDLEMHYRSLAYPCRWCHLTHTLGKDTSGFLRSATAIYMAQELWGVNISSFLLGCVQAIETLLDRPAPNPCPTCNRDMGPGPTRLFRAFVATNCLTGAV